MARNGSGFFNKFLNVIGLVDEPQDEGFNDRYANGRTAASARPSTYVPRQQNSRTAQTRQRTVVQQNARTTTRTSQPRYNDIDEGYTVRRPASSLDEEFDSAAAKPARRAPEPEPVSRGAAMRPAQNNVPAARAAARTVMFNIRSLEECSEVVDTLIANNIVLLMLDQMDDKLAQRVVDTLSGAAFALQATIKKASDRTYLIAPRTVEVNDPGLYGRRR